MNDNEEQKKEKDFWDELTRCEQQLMFVRDLLEQQANTIADLKAVVQKNIEECVSDPPQQATPRKPNIALIYDSKGWAFYNKSIAIQKHLGSDYNIDVVRYDELCNLRSYDLVLFYSPACIPLVLRRQKTMKRLSHIPYRNVIGGISSHVHFNHLSRYKGIRHVFSNDLELSTRLNFPYTYYAPNGVDTQFFQAREPRNIQSKDIINIGILSSVTRKEHKGGGRATEICTRLQEDGYKVNDLSCYIDAKKTETHLSQIQIRNWYKRLDVFIVSSVSEATPNPLLEAMAMGLPCVVNDVGMVPLLIENGKTGYITQGYDDIEGYTQHIKHLIHHPRTYARISKQARKQIEKYDWSIMAEGYRDMFDDYLATKDLVESDMTVVIKARVAPQALIKSIRKKYEKLNILVINESGSPMQLDYPYLRVIEPGLCKGWNAGIAAVNTKYFIICDSSLYFMEDTELSHLFHAMEEKAEIDIIGGIIESEGIEMGIFNLDGQEEQKQILTVKHGFKNYYKEHYLYTCDYVRGFFIARTGTFHEKQIRNEGGIEGDDFLFFFYDLWKNGQAKTALCKSVVVGDRRQKNKQNTINSLDGGIHLVNRGLTNIIFTNE